MSESEIMHIHIGQAGVQSGYACWELYCLEHAIQPNGEIAYEYIKANEDGVGPFFSKTPTGKCIPRSIMIDLDPTAIDEIRTGTHQKLFYSDYLLTGKEDAASNFARGMYTVGKEMLDFTMDRVRRSVEECDHLQGFIMYRSYGGGTGSGFTTILAENLYQDYGKTTITEYGIYPFPRLSPVIVEPYNTVFSAHGSLEYQDVSFLLDNQALYSILETHLDIYRPTYTNINKLLAQIVTNQTASLRYNDGLNISLLELETNLVPYPRLHFPLITYAPFIKASKTFYEQGSTVALADSCFHPANQLITCNPAEGMFLSCCMLFRGNVEPVDVNAAIHNVRCKRRKTFVDWCPTGFKVSINYLPPTCIPGGDLGNVERSVVMLSNSTSIKNIWENIADKFRKMYKNRAFVHHYIDEGMEESEFDDALEDIEALVQDYEEVSK